MLTSRVLLALILTVCLAAPTQPLWAQQPAPGPVQPSQPTASQPPPAPTPAAPPPIVENLKILILEGDGAINSIERRTAKIPIVEIRDENDKPVEGAEVIFRLPVTGAGGTFADQKSTKTVRTTLQGQAAATGFVPNDKSGRFEIQVNASIGNRIGKATISQINATGVKIEVEKKPGNTKFLGIGRKKVAIIAGLTAAAVIVGVVLLTRGGSSSTSSSGGSTITITPGPITIGGR